MYFVLFSTFLSMVISVLICSASKVELCHENPCQNDGLCFRAGDILEDNFCPKGFISYGGKCYILVKNLVSWEDAKRQCRELHSFLVSVESQMEREFIQAYVTETMGIDEENRDSAELPNIWSGGKGRGTRNQLRWAWDTTLRGRRLKLRRFNKDTFWQRHQPNTNNISLSETSEHLWTGGEYLVNDKETGITGYHWIKLEGPVVFSTDQRLLYWGEDAFPSTASKKDTCVSITPVSNYLNWAVQDCDSAKNYFICKTESEEPNEYTGEYNYQCRCTHGYAGRNCEIQPNPLAPIQVSHQTLCEDEPLTFVCPKDLDGEPLSIIVDYAAYGRPTNQVPRGCTGQAKELECVADNALLLLIQRCQGLPECYLPKLMEVFPTNPCLPGTSNFLEYRFRCVKGQQACPTDSYYFRGRCYRIGYKIDRTSRLSWQEAQQQCATDGGDLVGPISSDAHEFLTQKLKVIDKKRVKYFWIGLKSKQFEGEMGGEWNNGMEMDFKPTGTRFLGNEDLCISYYLQPGRAGRSDRVVWLAKNCDLFYNWICEFSSFGQSREKLYDPTWNVTQSTLPPDDTEAPETATIMMATVPQNMLPALMNSSNSSESQDLKLMAYEGYTSPAPSVINASLVVEEQITMMSLEPTGISDTTTTEGVQTNTATNAIEEEGTPVSEVVMLSTLMTSTPLSTSPISSTSTTSTPTITTSMATTPMLTTLMATTTETRTTYITSIIEINQTDHANVSDKMAEDVYESIIKGIINNTVSNGTDESVLEILEVHAQSNTSTDDYDLYNGDEYFKQSESDVFNETERRSTPSKEIQEPRINEVETPRTKQVPKPRVQELPKPRIQETKNPRENKGSRPRVQKVPKLRGQEVPKRRVQEHSKSTVEEVPEKKIQPVPKLMSQYVNGPRVTPATIQGPKPNAPKYSREQQNFMPSAPLENSGPIFSGSRIENNGNKEGKGSMSVRVKTLANRNRAGSNRTTDGWQRPIVPSTRPGLPTQTPKPLFTRPRITARPYFTTHRFVRPTPVETQTMFPIVENPVETISRTKPNRTVDLSAQQRPYVDLERLSVPKQMMCEGKTARGLDWPRTGEGAAATIPCPKGTVGNARWFCRKSKDIVAFYPSSPDLSECRHPWVGELEAQLERKRHALKITEDLAHNLQQTQELYGGDFAGSLDLMGNLLPLQRSQLLISSRALSPIDRANEASSFLGLIGQSSDTIMSRDHLKVWNDFPQAHRFRKISSLMSNLEHGAEMLTHFLGQKNLRAYAFDNLAMKIEVFRGSMGMEMASPPKFDYETLMNPGVESQNPSVSLSDAFIKPAKFIPGIGDQNSPSLTLPSIQVLRTAVEAQQPIPQDDATRGGGDRSSSLPGVAVRIGYFLFSNLGSVLEPDSVAMISEGGLPITITSNTSTVTIVNSHIIGASVNSPDMTLKLPADQSVTLKLMHIKKDTTHNPKCVFWNEQRSLWDATGCKLLETNREFTICSCNHLTSFAVLMDVKGFVSEALPTIHQEILKWVTMVGCGLSSVCLFICICVFTFFRSLWCDRTTIHRNLCISLLIAELLFLFGIDRTEIKIACTIIAGLLHYFFLAAFMWMLVEGYQLYLMLVKVFEPEKSKIWLYHVFSFGVPAIILGVTMPLRLGDYGTDKYCWINVRTPTIYAFIGPIALVLVINIGVLCLALRVVFKVKSLGDKSRIQKIKGWLKGSTMLLCLLGLTWTFGFLFVIDPLTIYFAYLFTILNCLQGVFIFAFHVVLNEKVHKILGKKCGGVCPCCISYNKESSSGVMVTSSSSNQHKKHHTIEPLSGHSDSTASTGILSGRFAIYSGNDTKNIRGSVSSFGSSNSGPSPIHGMHEHEHSHSLRWRQPNNPGHLLEQQQGSGYGWTFRSNQPTMNVNTGDSSWDGAKLISTSSESSYGTGSTKNRAAANSNKQQSKTTKPANVTYISTEDFDNSNGLHNPIFVEHF